MPRRSLLVLLPAIVISGVTAALGADPISPQDDPPAADAGTEPLRLDVDKSKVDLKGHKLEAKANRELTKIEIKVLGDSGAVLAQQELSCAGRAAGSTIEITWSPSSEETVARIELIAHDTKGYWVGVALVPWSVTIPHQDVVFKTASAEISDSEKAKLEASYTKITEILSKHQDLGTITLFIAGHTDTVGRAEDNLKLSLRRAQAIASWFRKRGLTLPIAYEGFGETSLLVKTADNVDEARNRRADYILSLDEPVFKTTGTFKAAWKKMN